MMFSISPKWILPSFHGPLTEEEMRENPGPEQVGLGYRVVSTVGVTEDVLIQFIVGFDILVDCCERPLYPKYAFLGALRSTAQMVPYEVSICLILIVRLMSTFGSMKAITRIFP
ncbi:LOW QUALITY PROTEIN: hypothetical protein CFC21_087852 [Triticum aestivum]|uniref:Uncharacterized protein n=2 Tax=Triticum aestivum TaxID=4565 RepID=A0A9R1II45_WHEAT|nr:LOW QUALITY PROTEIN: hypothetical protein CFC21_087852 [Triticum aestivum]